MRDGPDGPSTLCEDCGHDFSFDALPVRRDANGRLTARKADVQPLGSLIDEDSGSGAAPHGDAVPSTSGVAVDSTPAIPSSVRRSPSIDSDAEEVLDEGPPERPISRIRELPPSRLTSRQRVSPALPRTSKVGHFISAPTSSATLVATGSRDGRPTSGHSQQRFIRRRPSSSGSRDIFRQNSTSGLGSKTASEQGRQELSIIQRKQLIGSAQKKRKIETQCGTRLTQSTINLARFIERTQRSKPKPANPNSAKDLPSPAVSNIMSVSRTGDNPNEVIHVGSRPSSKEGAGPVHPTKKKECKDEVVEVVKVEQNLKPFSVKAALGSCLRRFSISGNLTYTSLVREVGRMFKTTRRLSVSYIDDEGDSITLSSDLELKEMMRMVRCRDSDSDLVRLELCYADDCG